MNWDLAIRALDGVAKAPLQLKVASSTVTISGSRDSLRELARLVLNLAADDADTGDEIELRAPLHLTEGEVRIRRL